jgi:hypothetical protein
MPAPGAAPRVHTEYRAGGSHRMQRVDDNEEIIERVAAIVCCRQASSPSWA